MTQPSTPDHVDTPYLVAQLTDLHIKAGGKLSYKKVDTAGALRAAVASVLALPQQPDVVVVTGDLVDFGNEAEYRFLRDLLAPLPMPVYLMPGNHDRRTALRRAFPDHGYLFQAGDGEDPVHYRADAGPLTLVSLDCTVPEAPHGHADAAALGWLAQALDAEATRPGGLDRPTLLLLHHPPFVTGIGHMDDQGLENSVGLEEIVRGHPRIERVLCGHLHRHIARRFGGTIAMTGPGPAHQVALDLDPEAESRFRMEPPGYLLHWWHPRHGMVTHAAPIGDFGPAYPFFDAQGKLID
jgi:Icc protein